MKLKIKYCFILATSLSLFSSFEATAQAVYQDAVNIALARNDSAAVAMPMTRGAIEGRQYFFDQDRFTLTYLRAQENFILLRDDFEGETVSQIQVQGQRVYDRYLAIAPSLAVSYKAAFDTKAAVRFQHKLAALTQAYYAAEATIRFTSPAYGGVPPVGTAAYDLKFQELVNWFTVGVRSSFPYLDAAGSLEVGSGGWENGVGRASLFALNFDVTGR